MILVDMCQNGKPRAVSEDEVNNYYRGSNLDYWIETSSKTAQNVEEVFNEVARQYLAVKQKTTEEKTTNDSLQVERNAQKSGCPC
jgi:hypothetical protein